MEANVTIGSGFAHLVAHWPATADASRAYLTMLDELDIHTSQAIDRLYDQVSPRLATELSGLRTGGRREVSWLQRLTDFVAQVDEADAEQVLSLDIYDPDSTDSSGSDDEFVWRPVTTSTTHSLLRSAVFGLVGPEATRDDYLSGAVDKWSQRSTPTFTMPAESWPAQAVEVMAGEPWDRLRSASGLRSDEDLRTALAVAARALSATPLLRQGMSMLFRDHFLHLCSADGVLSVKAAVPFVFQAKEPLTLSWDNEEMEIPAGSMVFLAETLDNRLSSDGHDVTADWVESGHYKGAFEWMTAPPPALHLHGTRLKVQECVPA